MKRDLGESIKNKKINIGLFVGDLKNDFDSAVCKGVMQGAKELDANLIIFPGRYLKADYKDKQQTRSAYQYNTIFSYANVQNIDVLIVLLGTMGTFLNPEEKRIFLETYKDIPILLLASDMEGYSSVNFDNKSGLIDGINYLIKRKNCRNIAMVSGPITNADARERLNVYKDVLKENGIEFDESKVVYGNFSEYSEGIVEELLDRHDNLDAIVFANDHMAIGGYKVLKERGYRIGEDILVTGFDNSFASTLLVPNLTSVNANAAQLGRVGIHEAVDLLLTKQIRKRIVKTKLIRRNSTGLRDLDTILSIQNKGFETILKEDLKKASKMICDEVFADDIEGADNLAYLEMCIDYTYNYFDTIMETDLVEQSKKRENLLFLLDKIQYSEVGMKKDLNDIFNLHDTIRTIVIKYLTQYARISGDIINSNLSHLTVVISAKQIKGDRDMDTLRWMSNSIARDMLVYGDGNDMSYMSVLNKLSKLGCRSAYLYSFKSPFVNNNSKAWHSWLVPDSMLLKSYYTDGDECVTVDSDEQEIAVMRIFTNDYMPDDRRYTIVVNNIFINEEQLGMLLLEIEHDQIYLIESIMAQLGSAFKIMHMLKMQTSIQRQLEFSLQRIKENNEMLETMSKCDELTGIYNRRGFFERASEYINNPLNVGKRAIMIFADLDNLKTINDHLGHDEGDFSIRGCAEILKESMRSSDIVARIGGDEFAVLAVTDSLADGESLRQRIKKTTDEFNEKSGKNYYIGISVGYCELVCDEKTLVETYLDKADDMLYEDKRNKRKDIMKH